MGICVSTIRLQSGTFVPCGKCYECIKARATSWAFRLQKEAERSCSAFFVTLTYNSENVPITGNCELTLRKSDLQKFFKRLRKINKTKLKYYAVGEYGGFSKRPHYHAILFNADEETIDKAWHLEDEKIGEIHIGQVSEASIAYTLKYIQSGKWKPEYELDDREPHFAVMSKKLGDNYMSDNMLKWHKADLVNRYYVPLKDGKKAPLSRYYKDKIYNEREKMKIQNYIVNKDVEKNSKISLDDVRNLEAIKIEQYRKFKRNPKNKKL